MGDQKTFDIEPLSPDDGPVDSMRKTLRNSGAHLAEAGLRMPIAKIAMGGFTPTEKFAQVLGEPHEPSLGGDMWMRAKGITNSLTGGVPLRVGQAVRGAAEGVAGAARGAWEGVGGMDGLRQAIGLPTREELNANLRVGAQAFDEKAFSIGRQVRAEDEADRRWRAEQLQGVDAAMQDFKKRWQGLRMPWDPAKGSGAIPGVSGAPVHNPSPSHPAPYVPVTSKRG